MRILDRTGIALGLALLLAGCGATGTAQPSSPSTSAPRSSDRPVAAAQVEDGRLLYSTFDEDTHTFLATFVSQSDGSAADEIQMPGPEGGGRWSRSGRTIAVMTLLPDDRVGTAIISADGTVRRVLRIPDRRLNLVCTVWSPDDRRLACEGFSEDEPALAGIYTVRSSDGGGLVRLTTTPEGAADLPGDYSPDGRTLLFSRGSSEDQASLMTVASSGGEPRDFAPGPVEDPGRFSPDGRWVLTSAGGTILVLGPDGAIVRRIARSGHFLFGAVWSPSGSQIAYSDAEGGPHADLYVAGDDGSERRQVTSTPDNEIRVEWAPPAPAH